MKISINETVSYFKEVGRQLPLFAVVDEDSNVLELNSEYDHISTPGPFFKVWVSKYQFKKLTRPFASENLSGKVIDSSTIRIYEH